MELVWLIFLKKLNNFIEMAPRLAEYIASREQGRSVEVSMLIQTSFLPAFHEDEIS